MLNLKPKPKVFVLGGSILATILIPLYSFAAMIAQNQRESKQQTKVELALPTVDYQAPELSSPKESSIRQSRSNRYDDSLMHVKELPPNVDQLPLNSHFWWALSSIPARQSDAIIVGEVNDAQAQLSNDKTGVYSEFTIRVEQTLKAPAGINPTSIVAERPGGGVRFPSGRIVRYEIHNQGMPTIGGRYLLFLRFNSEGDDYSVLTGYEFINGSIVPLDRIEGLFTKYEGWSETALLDLVTTTIKEGK